jgi:hypothetical protein
LEYDKIFFSDKRTNSTNESLEISLGTKLKIYPKQPSLQAASNEKKKGKKEGGSSQPKEENVKRELLSSCMEIA